MSKKLILLNFILLLLLIGCTNSQNVKLSYTDVDTIKDYVLDKENDIVWTNELEQNLLTANISSFNEIDNNVDVYPETLSIIPDYQKSIYPSISNFGSLNIEKLSEPSKKIINNFCKEISENLLELTENYFVNSYMFNYIFFKNEIINNWNVYFDEEFPVKIEEEENITNKESKNNEETKIQIFQKWYIGEPFINEKIIELPVRFIAKKGFIDVTIIMQNNNDNKIYQIVIDKWGK